jgi:ABC-type thiamine transport system ATPase subunit
MIVLVTAASLVLTRGRPVLLLDNDWTGLDQDDRAIVRRQIVLACLVVIGAIAAFFLSGQR